MQHRGAITNLSHLSFSLQTLRTELDSWVNRTRFEISQDLHEDEAKARDHNLKFFNSITQNQQKVYDAKMNALEKQLWRCGQVSANLSHKLAKTSPKWLPN